MWCWSFGRTATSRLLGHSFLSSEFDNCFTRDRADFQQNRLGDAMQPFYSVDQPRPITSIKGRCEFYLDK